MDNSEPKLISKKQFESWYIPEPLLIFGDGKTHVDPKAGLTLYGPLRTYDSKNASSMSIRVGVIGTGETIGLTKQFIHRLNGKIESQTKEPFQNPDFPGFQSIFDCMLMVSDNFDATIPNTSLKDCIQKPLFEDRVERTANLFLDRIESIDQRIPKPDVIICALPQ